MKLCGCQRNCLIILLFLRVYFPSVLWHGVVYSFCNLLLGKLSNSKLGQLFESGRCSLMTLIGWKEKILVIVHSILFGVLEFPDVWQILNKWSLWFGVSGSDQSYHHQTLGARWWIQAQLGGVELTRAGVGIQWCSQRGSSGTWINEGDTRCPFTALSAPCSGLCLSPSSLILSSPWVLMFGCSKWSYQNYEKYKGPWVFKRHFIETIWEESKIPDQPHRVMGLEEALEVIKSISLCPTSSVYKKGEQMQRNLLTWTKLQSSSRTRSGSAFTSSDAPTILISLLSQMLEIWRKNIQSQEKKAGQCHLATCILRLLLICWSI